METSEDDKASADIVVLHTAQAFLLCSRKVSFWGIVLTLLLCKRQRYQWYRFWDQISFSQMI